MNTIGIYGFKNLSNGKWYVGQSVDVFQRKSAHLSRLSNNTHSNLHLQRAFNLVGKAGFEFRLLELVEVPMLDIRERAWISYYKSDDRNTGYNIEKGGEATHVCSPETRHKIRLAHLGKRLSDKQREGLRVLALANKGRRHSEEAKQKMSFAKKQRKELPWSHERRQRRSEISRKLWAAVQKDDPIYVARNRKIATALTGRKLSPERRKNISEGLRLYRLNKLQTQLN
jgi:group I intron endonuclease